MTYLSNFKGRVVWGAIAVGLVALVMGGVLGVGGGVVYAVDPVFESGGGTRSIPENTPPGVNIGDPISATDTDEALEFGDTLTYSLGGTDAASFDIDALTGQLITKAPLDAETKASYSVTVTVKDSMGNDETQDVTITVTGVAEAPGALAAPTVVSTASSTDPVTYALKVIWYAPDEVGDGVDDYDVEYKKTTAVSFTDDGATITDTTTTIDNLDVDTPYQVRVRAKNSVGNGPWSVSSVGRTNKEGNSLPTFVSSTFTLNVLENSAHGLPVGPPVSATDNDNVVPLAYQLHGPDANSFDLQASTGQIRTKRGVVYDFEKKPALNVTVTVTDGQGGSDAIAVTINVTDVPERPSPPARPTVRATPGSSTSLDVSWAEPENTGPAITGYDIRYRKGTSDNFTLVNPSPTGTGTTYTLAPTGDNSLTAGASYEVSVRANNGEIIGEWSAAGTGRTATGNSEPKFDDRVSQDDTSPTTNRTVAENTRAGQPVGSAVRANDGNGDDRTYRLVAATVATHVEKFDINESTGQILTKAPLNHEATDCGYDNAVNPTVCTYTVRVQVWDGLDEDRTEQDTSSLNDNDDTNDDAIIDDTITVNIMVSDVAEKPAAPAVTVTSLVVADGATEASLTVTWDRPGNEGPPLTDYVVECSGDGITTSNPCPQPTSSDFNADTQTYNIEELTPYKSYRVRVRADNAEGEGTWSSWVTQFTSKAGNTLPAFTSPPSTVYVAENAPSARQPVTQNADGTNVIALQATDDDNDSPLTLRLEGSGASRFDINSSTGQITTKAKLNYEDAECNPDGTACSYSVRVKLSDPNGGSVSHPLTINVTDKEELPEKPAAPRVTETPGSGWSLEVSWSAPRNDGPPITGYQIRYRPTGVNDAIWQQWPIDGSNVTDTSVRITTSLEDPTVAGGNQVHLDQSTQYEVQVRALNGEEPGTLTFANATNWSNSGRGTTGKGNRRPAFENTDSVVMLEVEENTRSGQNVGSAVEATDADNNRLIYTLEGPGKDSFTITSSGQIRTRSSLNHEDRGEYSVTIKVDDRQGKNNSVAAKSVTIEVTDRPESPSAPAAPTVAGIPGSTDSVRVTWNAPANTGPAITRYNLRYAVSGSNDAFTPVDPPVGSADRSAVITGLSAGTRYEVQVRAWNDEGHGDWSRSGTGQPNPDDTNRNPAFSTRSHTFNIAENTLPGTDVGNLVAALDPDGDTLTYTLTGVDADSFDIIATNNAGQIQTKAPLNFEQKVSYSVAIRARDGRGGTDAVNVTIRVTDIDTEAPDTPFAPTVTAASSTSVQVSWDAPSNTGPPITDYDYRYRIVTDSAWNEVTNTTITGRTVTITGLRASTSYDVEVRAKNAEGTSGWSNPGNGPTNAPGANSRPVFSDGASATRSVRASAQSGTNVGAAIGATDADSGDTITYSLEGRDAALFDMNSATGQIMTKSGVTLFVGETYSVTVAADDGTDTARIPVSIDAIAAPPNALPAFTEGSSTTRSVARNAGAGTSIGQPVRATDTDTADTLTYTLEGTDAASFGINSSTGQLLTLTGVTLQERSYSVTVVATDTPGDRATISVTITATDSAGTVTLSNARPEVGQSVTASVTDPDGGVTGVTWQWATSTNGTSNWVIILGATSNSYTATAANQGSFIRATASYTDAGGSGKSAEGITAAAVAQDDDGVVTLSTSTPRVGTAVTASLSDPDGGVTGVTWQWEKSSSRTSGWASIAGATTATYVPRQGDLGSYLRATASYTDAVGSGKSAEAVTTSTVAAQALVAMYDANGNGMIERSEALEAVKDYFNDEISLEDVVAVIREFFG